MKKIQQAYLAAYAPLKIRVSLKALATVATLTVRGNYKLDGKDIISAMEEAEKKVGQVNTEGTKLRDKFTYKKQLTL